MPRRGLGDHRGGSREPSLHLIGCRVAGRDVASACARQLRRGVVARVPCPGLQVAALGPPRPAHLEPHAKPPAEFGAMPLVGIGSLA